MRIFFCCLSESGQTDFLLFRAVRTGNFGVYAIQNWRNETFAKKKIQKKSDKKARNPFVGTDSMGY